MALSGMLATYLHRRIDRSTPFLLGHWLRVVDEETLAGSRGAFGAFDAGDVPHALWIATGAHAWLALVVTAQIFKGRKICRLLRRASRAESG